MPTPTDPFIGRGLLHYEVLKKIGHGGMGVVYLARDPHLQRQVAIKVLASANEQTRERFVREARAASALNHPHIVTIHDIARDDTVDFIVMEYVEGQPLDRLIPRRGMSVRDAVEYGLQIADAIAAAHRAGIVHRDLKPANVIATSTGRVRVLDFGLAKRTATGGIARIAYANALGTLGQIDRARAEIERVLANNPAIRPEFYRQSVYLLSRTDERAAPHLAGLRAAGWITA